MLQPQRFRAFLLSLMLGLAAGPGLVAGEGREKSAREWLENLESALEETSYRGVFVYTRGSEVNSMGIVHHYRDGQVVEKLSQLDGGKGEILREGDTIVCVLPEHGRLQLDALLPAGPFTGSFSDRLQPISRWYRAHRLEDSRIADFDAVVVAVSAKDEHRYSYRLWLERDSGILLKSQVRNSSDQVLERFQFTQLEITNDISETELKVSPAGGQLLRIEQEHGKPRAAAAPASTESAPGGWQPGWVPAGFTAIGTGDGSKRPRLTYSDGIASFSVFVEPRGATEMPEGASSIGATTAYLHTMTSPDDDYRVAVVGEIPPATAMRVARSVRSAAAAPEPDRAGLADD